MRRLGFLLLILVFQLMVLNGCQHNEVKEKPLQQPEKQSEDKAELRLIEGVPGKSIDTAAMTKLDEFSYDFDLDNIEEKVELYTSAERNEDGEMLWDDGQNWLLVVWDGEKAYPLLSEYVQLGFVYYSISNHDGGEVSHITVIVPTGSNLSLKTYAFDKEKSGFLEDVIYVSKDNNYIHNSMPSY